MALIKCSECGKVISDKAKECPNCGFPVDNIKYAENNIRQKGINGKDKKFYGFILGTIIVLTLILAIFIAYTNSESQTLTCTLVENYSDYNVEFKRVFYYKNQVLSTFDLNTYMKFNDSNTGEIMFKFFDKNTDDFNKYEGVEYKVTFNVKNELRVLANIDVVSAPEMFVAINSSTISNIDENSSINDIKSALEKEKYTCKIK